MTPTRSRYQLYAPLALLALLTLIGGDIYWLYLGWLAIGGTVIMGKIERAPLPLYGLCAAGEGFSLRFVALAIYHAFWWPWHLLP